MYKDFGEEANRIINDLHSALESRNEQLEMAIDRNAQNAAVDTLVSDLEKAVDNARKTGLVQFATAIGCLRIIMGDLEREELRERALTPMVEPPPPGSHELHWCVHIYGPDDVIAMPSKERADRQAATINFSVGRHWQENDPEIYAIAELWPYSPESHATALTEVLEAERKLSESV